MRRRQLARAFPALVLLSLVVTACEDSPTAPSHFAPYSQVDIRVGTGTEATSGSTVTVNYSGWLYDETKSDRKGLLFDTSTGRGTLSFTLGAGEVIAGWDVGVVGMKVGGLRRLVIPPSLGYGGVRNSLIPPFATLLFEVELVSVGDES
ncbi:MAG: FKBP-type peptidyl-prolyl cis-trans isomerase [Vicinamibacterales bacterium]